MNRKLVSSTKWENSLAGLGTTTNNPHEDSWLGSGCSIVVGPYSDEEGSAPTVSLAQVGEVARTRQTVVDVANSKPKFVLTVIKSLDMGKMAASC